MFRSNKTSQKTLLLAFNNQKRYTSFSFKILWEHTQRPDLNRSLVQRIIKNSDRVVAIRLSPKGNLRTTPLHVAVIAGDSKAVKLLIAEGNEDPTQKDKCGISPLDLALAINEDDVINAIDPNRQFQSKYSMLSSEKCIIYDLNLDSGLEEVEKTSNKLKLPN